MYTVYKSTDAGASALIMTAAAGSIITVLDGCLVNGYAGKAAAGWTKAAVDAGTQQFTYTQGASTGLAQKKIYVKDDATYPGNATAWACDSCTTSATPTFTNNFWATDTTNIGILVKADQENGGVAKWMIIANSRFAYLFTRRSNWGTRGWQMTFFGDLDSSYPDDKGKFAVTGFNLTQGALTMGAACRAMSTYFIGVYGNQDGTYGYTSYGYKRAIGDTAGYAENVVPRSTSASGILLSKIFAADAKRFRGELPQLYRTVSSLDNFSWYMLPDDYTIQNADASKSFLHLQFGGVITGTTDVGRVFMDITGAS